MTKVRLLRRTFEYKNLAVMTEGELAAPSKRLEPGFRPAKQRGFLKS